MYEKITNKVIDLRFFEKQQIDSSINEMKTTQWKTSPIDLANQKKEYLEWRTKEYYTKYYKIHEHDQKVQALWDIIRTQKLRNHGMKESWDKT